jgi:hypothetical protein
MINAAILYIIGLAPNAAPWRPELGTSRLQPFGDFAADSLQIATSETFYTN